MEIGWRHLSGSSSTSQTALSLLSRLIQLIRSIHHAARRRRPGRPLDHRVFRSVEAKDANENSDVSDELRDEIIDLLAEPPVRIEAYPYSAIPALPGAAVLLIRSLALSVISFRDRAE